MPDLKALGIKQLHAAVESLERLKDNRAAKVASVAELQAAIQTLAADITAQRQKVRQLASRLRPDLDDI